MKALLAHPHPMVRFWAIHHAPETRDRTAFSEALIRTMDDPNVVTEPFFADTAGRILGGDVVTRLAWTMIQSKEPSKRSFSLKVLLADVPGQTAWAAIDARLRAPLEAMLRGPCTPSFVAELLDAIVARRLSIPVPLWQEILARADALELVRLFFLGNAYEEPFDLLWRLRGEPGALDIARSMMTMLRGTEYHINLIDLALFVLWHAGSDESAHASVAQALADAPGVFLWTALNRPPIASLIPSLLRALEEENLCESDESEQDDTLKSIIEYVEPLSTDAQLQALVGCLWLLSHPPRPVLLQRLRGANPATVSAEVRRQITEQPHTADYPFLGWFAGAETVALMLDGLPRGHWEHRVEIAIALCDRLSRPAVPPAPPALRAQLRPHLAALVRTLSDGLHPETPYHWPGVRRALSLLMAAASASDWDTLGALLPQLRRSWRVLRAAGRHAGVEAVPALARLMKDAGHPRLAAQAGLALGGIDSPEALRCLTEALQAEGAHAQHAALGLGVRQGADTIAPLVEALCRWDTDVQYAASQALLAQGDAAREPVLARLDDPTLRSTARSRMRWLLDALGHAPAAPPSETTAPVPLAQQLSTLETAESHRREELIEAIIAHKDAAACPALRAHHDRTDALESRALYAMALGVLGDDHGWPTLRTAADHHAWDFAWFAARGMAGFSSYEARQALKALVSHDHEMVREAAVRSLQRYADPYLPDDPLSIGLQDEDESVRQATLEVLAACPPEAAKKHVLAALRDHHAQIRTSAYRTLAVLIGQGMGTDGLHEALTGGLSDPSLSVVVEATGACLAAGLPEGAAKLQTLAGAGALARHPRLRARIAVLDGSERVR